MKPTASPLTLRDVIRKHFPPPADEQAREDRKRTLLADPINQHLCRAWSSAMTKGAHHEYP